MPKRNRKKTPRRAVWDDGAVNESLRTCVGCRQRAPRAELVRLVVADGEVVVDRDRRLPGRGVHLHPGPDCLALALRRRALARGLRSADARTDGLAGDPVFGS